MKIFLMILLSFTMVYATEPVKKAPIPAVAVKKVILSYEQQVKNIQSYYNQQVTAIQKAKNNNDAIVSKVNADNQRLLSKEDSIKTVVQTKLQELFEAEIKKIQTAQDNLNNKKSEIDRINKDAVSILPK